jgi:hypothetical protein
MKQPEGSLTVDMFATVGDKKQELAERIAAAKQQVARENSPVNNELLVHLYVASSLELYLDYFGKFRTAINSWGVDAALKIPELPAYYTVCPVCGKQCGDLTILRQHKLLSTACSQCEREFRSNEPLVGAYAIHEMAKHMKQKPEAVEHFICAGLIARRAAKLQQLKENGK